MSSESSFWISDKDRNGVPLDARVLDAARQIWTRVAQFAQAKLRDPDQALEILESTAVAVSRVVRQSRAKPVRDLEAYLLWSCIRKIARIAARESREQPNHALLDSAAASDRGACQSELEQKLSVRDALCFMDDRSRELFAMRCERYSWKEIADVLGYSNSHSAEVQYFKGLKAARQRLNRRLRNRRQA